VGNQTLTPITKECEVKRSINYIYASGAIGCMIGMFCELIGDGKVDDILFVAGVYFLAQIAKGAK